MLNCTLNMSPSYLTFTETHFPAWQSPALLRTLRTSSTKAIGYGYMSLKRHGISQPEMQDMPASCIFVIS